MTTIARWILVVPAALIGWYVALFVGIFMFEGLDKVCPSQYQISAHCIAGLGGVLKDGIMVFSAALSATLVVAFATFIAPQYKTAVAYIAYFVGATFVTYLAYDTGFGLPYFGAIVCGLLTALYIHRRDVRLKADSTSRPTLIGD